MNAKTTDVLQGFAKQYEFLVGIDSDGCVFDTMEMKQKLCFHGEIVKHWGLEKIEKQVRRAAEFVNLYSHWRGVNRFIGLLKTFELLADWEEVLETGVSLPDWSALNTFIESGLPLSNEALKHEAERTGEAMLHQCLAWSHAVNENVGQKVQRAPLFNGVPEALQKMHTAADLIVVSQTPTDAITREWKDNAIAGYVHAIAGQELGTKSEHLQCAMEGRYAPDQVLMVGDAPGDLKAAQTVGARFFPINPGHEDSSWQQLLNESFDRFIQGSFDDRYQKELIDAFEALLPSTPPWKA